MPFNILSDFSDSDSNQKICIKHPKAISIS